MTTKHILLAVVLVMTAAVPAVGVGSAAPSTEEAQLSIQQPHYIDNAVKTTSENGTNVYRVRGERIEITPQNFESSEVTDYGVSTDGGQLSYDAKFGEFVFSADKTGTYQVYWSVTRQVTVQNETGNGSHVEEQSQRYAAKIRLEGQTAMLHKPEGTMQESKSDAQKWRNFNSTVQELREEGGLLTDLGIANQKNTQEVIQGMVNAYQTVHQPFKMLTGNFTAMVLMSVTTLGGWLFMLFIAGPLIFVIGYLYYKINTKESIEADEGKLSRRIAKFEEERNKNALANSRFNDVFGDDHVADAMREEGRNPLQAMVNWYSKLRDRNILHARVQAMAQCGFVGVVDERTATDGGIDHDDSEVIRAHVATVDDVPKDAETVDLADIDPDGGFLDALDWEQEAIQKFNLVDADFDRSEVETPTDTYDLRELVELMDVDMREFEDETVAAEYLRDMFADIREHPLTDDRGTPDTLRYSLEQHLDAANLLNDRFEMPIQYRVEVLERALVEFDAGAEAEETLDDIREGAYA